MISSLVPALISAFKARRELALENALRQQLAVLRRSVKRPRLSNVDRGFWVLLRRIWTDWERVLVIVKPETVVRWHRCGFRRYWTWKSRRRRPGRPGVAPEIRELIRNMSRANPLWGAPRVHGELAKLGISISKAAVSKYMVRHRIPPSHTWRSVLDNHAKDLVSLDFFTLPTATFRVLFVFIVLRHDRRRIVHFNVTEHPSAEWTAQQMVNAFPWDTAPRYLVQTYGRTSTLASTALTPRSPWQNPLGVDLIFTQQLRTLSLVCNRLFLNEKKKGQSSYSLANYLTEKRSLISTMLPGTSTQPSRLPMATPIRSAVPSSRNSDTCFLKTTREWRK